MAFADSNMLLSVSPRRVARKVVRAAARRDSVVFIGWRTRIAAALQGILPRPLADGFVSRFLDRRGEGVHHVTFRVSDLTDQVERMRAGGVELMQVSLDDEHWKEAFIHPRHAHGVLIQLAESPHGDDESARHFRDAFPEAALLATP